MKCNLHQSLWDKTKEVHLTTLITLLTTAISILAVCDLAADDHDIIKLSNQGSGEIALWVSEKKEDGSIKSTVLKGNTGDNTFTGTFSGKPGAVIAYTADHPPTLKTNVPWTNGIQSVPMRLDDIYRIRLSIWVVNGDFNTIKQKALEAWLRTNQIWSDERQGVALIAFNAINKTGKLDSTGASVPQKFLSEPFNCGRASEIMNSRDGIGFTPGVLNVYYVETVEVEGVQGGSFGEYCGSDDLIALGVNSDDAVLAHELGHAFTLEHIDTTQFDKTNVMHPASDERIFLTEGQTFRAIANVGSAINILYKTRPKAPTVSCITSDKLTEYDCPEIQQRIWPDGDEGTVRDDLRKERLLPPMEALQNYLDSDHQDDLGMELKGHAPPQTMQKVLNFEKDLEPEFIRLLDKGLNNQVIEKRTLFLEEQWTRREAFLKKKPNLGLKMSDRMILRKTAKQAYVNQGREQLIQRHQEKAIGALLAIDTPTAILALRNFRNNTNNKVLKEIIEHKLPSPPGQPTGLTVH
jgi:hypothetical protein